jgi:hypothetical protein
MPVNFSVLRFSNWPGLRVTLATLHRPSSAFAGAGFAPLRYGRPIALALLALAYFAFIDARPDFTPFNADDGSDYLALSWSLVHGLGYTRNMIAGSYVPHTTWPPGMAVLLAPAMAWSGDTVDFFAVKATMIVTALSAIVLAWYYVRRLTQSKGAADLAALLLALDPFFWNFSRIAMTEVPSIAWWLGGLLLIDHVWTGKRPGWRATLGVGAILGAGMLLRGSLFVLAFAPLGYLFERRAPLLSRPTQLKLWLVYAAGFGLCFVAWALRNASIDSSPLGFDGINQLRMIFARNPVDAASPLMTLSEIIANSVFNLHQLIIYRVPEASDWSAWPDAGFAAAALCAALAVAAWPWRRIGAPILATLIPSIALLLIYAWGGSARFWVPVTALTLPLLAINLQGWLRHRRPQLRRCLVACMLAGYAASLGFYIAAHERNPYGEEKWATLAALFERARGLDAQPLGVWTLEPQAYQLMTGQKAPMTVEALGIVPLYSHMATATGDDMVPPPSGSVAVLSAAPWTLYRLPHPMRQQDIVDAAHR